MVNGVIHSLLKCMGEALKSACVLFINTKTNFECYFIGFNVNLVTQGLRQMAWMEVVCDINVKVNHFQYILNGKHYWYSFGQSN